MSDGRVHHRQGRSYVQDYLQTPTESDERLGEAEGRRTIEVFFRSLSEPEPHQFQRELLAEIQRLQEVGAVDDHTVTLFGGKLCCCEACAETAATRDRLEEIERWRAWAADAGVSLCLEEHTVDSSLTGQQYEFVVPPTATVVCRVGGKTSAVLPHRDGGEVITPYEYLSTVSQTKGGQPIVVADAEETAD